MTIYPHPPTTYIFSVSAFMINFLYVCVSQNKFKNIFFSFFIFYFVKTFIINISPVIFSPNFWNTLSMAIVFVQRLEYFTQYSYLALELFFPVPNHSSSKYCPFLLHCVRNHHFLFFHWFRFSCKILRIGQCCLALSNVCHFTEYVCVTLLNIHQSEQT